VRGTATIPIYIIYILLNYFFKLYYHLDGEYNYIYPPPKLEYCGKSDNVRRSYGRKTISVFLHDLDFDLGL